MKTKTTAPALLDDLYEAAIDARHWPRFLSRLAGLFQAGTASLRLTGRDSPVVYRSHTVGFDAAADRRYADELVVADPFRKALSEAPLGKVRVSHECLPDREYARTEHYQHVFRPNGNFYCMGAQFERRDCTALHIGVHRPHTAGPFEEGERKVLEFFSPHLRRAVAMMQAMDQLDSALRQARAALDRLPFAVWLLNRNLGCQWMNAVAEQTVRDGLYGLAVKRDRLALIGAGSGRRLCSAAHAIEAGRSAAEIVRTDTPGVTLVLATEPDGSVPDRAGQMGVLAFLLDSHRRVTPDVGYLAAVYSLTTAETRLVMELLRGRDVAEAGEALGVSVHTARCQLKSVMQKTGSPRQADLMRRLLVGMGSIRPAGCC